MNDSRENTNKDITEEEFIATLVTIIVLFCASGTDIHGSIVSGTEGNHSLLLAKSIPDLFPAAGIIFPMTTPEMIADDDFLKMAFIQITAKNSLWTAVAKSGVVVF